MTNRGACALLVLISLGVSACTSVSPGLGSNEPLPRKEDPEPIAR